MRLKYNCPGCGTPLGYKGLCWKCKCEQERKNALAWTPEQIAEKQKNLTINIQRLVDMKDPELTDFWQLLGYRDAITPEIQRSALTAGVFYPNELYRSSTSMPATPWSRVCPARYPLSASAGHGRTPAPTAADGWWTCWCWTAGTSG